MAGRAHQQNAQATVLLAKPRAQGRGEMVNALQGLVLTEHQAELSGFHWAERATVLFLFVEFNENQHISVSCGTRRVVAGTVNPSTTEAEAGSRYL